MSKRQILNILETADRKAKRSKIWYSGVQVEHYMG